MCMNKRKLAAFTIIELTVVMAISALLMAAVFYSFHFFSREFQGLIRTLDQRQTQYQFESRLRKDFSEALYILDAGQALEMQGNKGRVDYQFYRDYLIRTQAGRKDTLPYGLLRFSIEELSTLSDDQLVNGLQLSLQRENSDDEFVLELYKVYSPEILMEGIKE